MRKPIIVATMLAASLALLVLLVSISYGLRDMLVEHPPFAEGAFDARGSDLGHRQSHALYNPSSMYYPGAYETPAELEGITMVPYEGTASRAEAAAFRFLILLPDNNPVYTEFAIPGKSGKLFVNGALLDGNLPFGRDTEGVGYTDPYKVVMTPDNNRLDIVMMVEAYQPGDFNWTYIKLSTPEYQRTQDNRLVMLDTFFIGALALSFTLFVALYLLKLHAPENLIFAIICLLAALRRSVISMQVMYLVIPDYAFTIKTEHLSLTLIMPLIILYVNRMFPKLFQKPVLIAVCGSYAAYALLIGFTRYAVYRPFLLMYYAITAFAMVYVFARFCITRRGLNLEQTIALIGFAVIVLAFINDVLYYSAIRRFIIGLGLYEILDQALLVFVLAQMISLFLSNARQTAEAREAERRLADENASLDRLSRLKTEFLGNVSHELKTPLAVALSVAQNVEESLEERGGALAADMKLLTSEIDRMGLMVTQLLDATRIEENSMIWAMRACSAEEIIQQTKARYYPLIKRNGNRLVLQPADGLPLVWADPDRIAQVLVNLLQNAVRHTQNGTITVSAATVGHVGLGAPVFVGISVSDTGEGIEPERLPMIFERYKSHDSAKKTRRDTGTGLGLFICKHIVEAHGGTIEIESEPGRGTTASFTIPVPPPVA